MGHQRLMCLIAFADSDDPFENIFHLVLAGPAGTEWTSLVFMRKCHLNCETVELANEPMGSSPTWKTRCA